MSNRTLSAHAHLVIPTPPRRAASASRAAGLGPVQEFSLVGLLSLGFFWGLAELALLILG